MEIYSVYFTGAKSSFPHNTINVRHCNDYDAELLIKEMVAREKWENKLMKYLHEVNTESRNASYIKWPVMNKLIFQLTYTSG